MSNNNLIVCEGTLMNHDRPLADFAINECNMGGITPIEQEGRFYPWEMRREQSWANFLKFLEARITPRTRQGIDKDLKEAGYDSYSFAAILITSNGRDCSDPYWVRFKEGPQTWKEVWEAIGITYKTNI